MRIGLLIAGLVIAPLAAWAEPTRTLGWLEHVSFPQAGLTLVAKLDTGAQTSSIDADELERFDRDGASWVRFKIGGRDGVRPTTIEAPVVAQKRILSSLGRQSRFAVELELCLGGLRQKTLFTLLKRGDLAQPVLVGRRALEGRFAVDPSRSFTAEPPCAVP